MAPSNKQKKKNAFGIFLDEYVKTQRSKGRNISHRIGAEECALLWQKMPKEEKQAYVDIAAAAKTYSGKEKEMKFTSTGVSFAELDRKQLVAKEKIERANQEITSTMERFSLKTIRKHLFYTIHCHYIVKMEDGTYVPGEIALCEFSLEAGITKTYHRLINSGPLPVGYGYQAKLLRETVHDLPVPPYEDGVSDYLEILNDILKFIEPGHCATGKRPPFYAAEDDIFPIENVLQQFSDKVKRGENIFRVYPLHKMFFKLKNKCVELAGDFLSGFPVLSNASSEIEKDTYRYVSGISCEYHTPSDRFYYTCSLSVVQRYAYLICDHCCQHLGIPLLPGKHIRMNADVKQERPKEWYENPKPPIKKGHEKKTFY